MNIQANETNTGGGSMVTILTSDSWEYILVINDETAAAYNSEDEFFNGGDPIAFTFINP